MLLACSFVAAAWCIPAGSAGVEGKIQYLQSNSKRKPPDPHPTAFSEAEINAYLAAGKVALPAGVQSVRFAAEPGVVTATTRVDFDRLKAGRASWNPALAVFSGLHDVIVTAQARGTRGTGYVEVDTVSLDGVEIPRFVLQLFIEKYLQPRYPNVGLNSRFPLPARIATATVGAHKVTVVQQ
ncbi:MAG: hypothetical protein JST79_07850 [Acidobacteria bacterium]|jgi:hypothetical protein|nr:hypothetical protein [Acidobacteriota bacterium]